MMMMSMHVPNCSSTLTDTSASFLSLFNYTFGEGVETETLKT